MWVKLGQDYSLLAYNIISDAKINQSVLDLVKLIINTCNN